MISQYIQEGLALRGFQKIQTNAENISVQYNMQENNVCVVVLFLCPEGTEFAQEQYHHVVWQIENQLKTKYGLPVRTLSLFYTEHPEEIKRWDWTPDSRWMIDSRNRKLLVYEDQGTEFPQLYEMIEDILFRLEEQAQPWRLKQQEIAVGTLLLVVMNTLIFFLSEFSAKMDGSYLLLQKCALSWTDVIYHGEYYRLFTCLFFHSGIRHLANNLLILYLMGTRLESIIGTGKYTIIYFASGILAGVTSMGYNMLIGEAAISVGASGAIFGIVGALLWVVIANRGRVQGLSARQMGLFVALSLYGGFVNQQTDNAAHIGGVIAGLLIAALFYRKNGMRKGHKGED